MIILYTDHGRNSELLARWLAYWGFDFEEKNITDLEEITPEMWPMNPPVLQIGEVYHPSGWLFDGQTLQTGKIREALKEQMA